MSKERLEALQKELAAMRDEFQTMSAKWEERRPPSARCRSCARRSSASTANRQSRAGYDLNKAAELKYGQLPSLQKQLQEEEKKAESVEKKRHPAAG